MVLPVLKTKGFNTILTTLLSDIFAVHLGPYSSAKLY